MSRSVRIVGIAMAGALAGIAAALITSGSTIPDLAVLTAALVIGELVELRPAERAALPLSFAVIVVLVRAATPVQFVIVVIVGELVAILLRTEPEAIASRLILTAERITEALAAGAAYRVVVETWTRADDRAVVLGALTAAAIAEIVVADIITLVREHRVARLRDRAADLAIITSGILMAVGYGGIDGKGDLGLWGPLLFSIPLIAAWYSFELLASTRKSFDQTVRALAAAPELGGLVREGHAERVASLANGMGRELSMSPSELQQLETAALLHHLGAVCLDEPEPGDVLDPIRVAESGAAMLRASEELAPAGDVVAAEPLLHRPPRPAETPIAALSGMVLKVASAYDELTEGRDEHAAWAVEALYTGPGYVYDGKVLGALERVLERRGALIPMR
jgi:HD-GYP domain-containing protein (c-di-GMP phosphodiesterase class II)